MGQVSTETAQRIRDHVLRANILRLTIEETIQYLRLDNLPSSAKTVKRYRAMIKESAANWISSLAQSKRSDYIAQYKERIDEIEACQKELWKIIYDKQTKQHVKVEAMGKLMDCTARLKELYDSAPVVAAIRDYGCGFDHHDAQQKTKGENEITE